MPRPYLLLFIFLTASVLYSCSKKNHPSRTPQPGENNTSSVVNKAEENNTSSVVNKAEENNTSSVVNKDDSSLIKKPAPRRKEKAIIPKVITVNDSVAHKSVDGRYYYDVLGHRYWRNNKDGKYYLFNKSMYTDDAFKKPD